jgi:prevent-host-death family protein
MKGDMDMLQVTATALKSNLGKYLSLAKKEEVHITKNGEDIAILVAPKPKISWVDEITGIISNNTIDAKESKSDRLTAKYENIY